MHRAGITAGGDLPGAVDEFADSRAVGDADAVLGEGRGDGDVVYFLEAAGAVTLESARTGYEDYRRALPPGFHHRRHRVGKSFRPHQADRRLSGDAGVAVRQVPGDLLVGAVDHRQSAFHESFQRRIAKPAGEGENMLHALFVQRPRQQVAAPDFSFGHHHFTVR